MSYNYDDLFEDARDLSVLPIAHLHGWARQPERGYVFEIAEYARVVAQNNVWSHLLANLIRTAQDDVAEVARWQAELKQKGVWVSEPVPMFPFPGSPLYVQTFGAAPDDEAWERAHRYYLGLFADKGFSDIQEEAPVALEELECMSF